VPPVDTLECVTVTAVKLTKVSVVRWQPLPKADVSSAKELKAAAANGHSEARAGKKRMAYSYHGQRAIAGESFLVSGHSFLALAHSFLALAHSFLALAQGFRYLAARW
jgi:hypothetical protein